MKPHLSERAVSGCPCGRTHGPQGARKRRSTTGRPESEALPRTAYLAAIEGRIDGRKISQQRSCVDPVTVRQQNGNLFYEVSVRCRKCGPCRVAKANYWIYAAMHQFSVAPGRTWFGTLTLDPEQQGIVRDMARSASSDPTIWWDNPKCDAVFKAVRDILVPETRRMWARLRKGGHRFKYLLVFERHKSGLPHMHFLVHEYSGPIRKRQLQAAWWLGFSKMKLVPADDQNRVSFYVAKYLAKSPQARQIASRGYKPEVRA